MVWDARVQADVAEVDHRVNARAGALRQCFAAALLRIKKTVDRKIAATQGG